MNNKQFIKLLEKYLYTHVTRKPAEFLMNTKHSASIFASEASQQTLKTCQMSVKMALAHIRQKPS